ncbi:hypothetical protein K443DRAFT_133396 [Laccaria amethystina LaAM-08-1]|uniref:Cytochrome P450 n=1 Tax=Laccaria amethystina LaAM-08-1 TaxID=1095629 RepID=A0A0C9WMU8_9AGAR|nr:hypothetical protein K443DRAFT_133396 [Laccaria amethystina LaAM-08-1]
MLLWRFVGRTNVILSNGLNWQRHSRVVKSALNRNVPIEKFASLTKKLFTVMGDGGRLLTFNTILTEANRFILWLLSGKTALGHDFNTIVDNNSPFVKKYNEVMDSIASPLFLVFPKLETWFPRKHVIRKIDDLVKDFGQLLEDKKQRPGNDMLTYMIEEPEMTDEEFRDNMVVFFIAGHDTTAGAMSSFVYYLSKHPEAQVRARKEVVAALGKDEPNIENLRHMPFLQACIRESLRINTPIIPTVITLDLCSNGKSYHIPAKTSVIMNICAIHYNETYWPNPYKFDPTRFMNQGDGEEARIDASLWLPFALGPRQCPARNFAMYELRTLASMLLQQWEWDLPADSPHRDGIKNGFSPFALSLPKDLDINFRRVEQ